MNGQQQPFISELIIVKLDGDAIRRQEIHVRKTLNLDANTFNYTLQRAF